MHFLAGPIFGNVFKGEIFVQRGFGVLASLGHGRVCKLVRFPLYAPVVENSKENNLTVLHD